MIGLLYAVSKAMSHSSWTFCLPMKLSYYIL